MDLFDPRVVRASMGSMFSLRLRVYDDFARYRADYPAHALYPFMLDGSCSLPEALAEPCQSAMPWFSGNEGSRLPGSLRAWASLCSIPSNNRIDSLNLAVAGGHWLTVSPKGMKGIKIHGTHGFIRRARRSLGPHGGAGEKLPEGSIT